jgi:signal peptidase
MGFLLAVTILGWSVIGAHFFGYRFVTAHGGSMEPVLRDGDMIWVRFVDAVDIEAGDIVTLENPENGLITHRVVEVRPLFQERYFLVTKGDANWLTETWEISGDEAVPVSVARIPLAGYVVDFLGSGFGRVYLIVLAAATVVGMVLRLRQRHMARTTG